MQVKFNNIPLKMNASRNEVMENYAWVDELLEKKYYDYVAAEEDDIKRDYETFAYENATDFDLLISDLKKIISYHEDRKQRRRSEEVDNVFALFNQLNVHN